MQDSTKQLLTQEFQNPKNIGKPDWVYTHTAKVENLSCGDEITFYTKVDYRTIDKIAYHAEGCSIMIACASIISEKLKDRSIQEVKSLIKKDIKDILGFELPEARIKCGEIVVEAVREMLASSSS